MGRVPVKAQYEAVVRPHGLGLARYRDPRPRPGGLVPKLASSRDRGPTISEVDRHWQLEHEHDSPHITARA